jgi:NAD(P)-dependent dehydrogenase (short-subunit alcohol dehydrogenase family)
VPSLAGRTAVVTGASRGIGRAAALALAEAGAHVIAVARTVGGLEELDDAVRTKGGSATLVPVDLRDGAAIDRLGAAIYERWGKLDMLLANAGILGVVTPLAHLDPKTWDEVLAVNLTANWRLIRSLDALLRASDVGRALFLSAGATNARLPFWGAYTITKVALEAMVATYAAEIANTKARANAFNPGPLRTRLRAAGNPGEDPATVPLPETITPHIVRMLSPDYSENGAIFDLESGGTTRRLAAR